MIKEHPTRNAFTVAFGVGAFFFVAIRYCIYAGYF
ncbi:hypothetical protein Rleg4DRAFT_4384 [Rhizobium leguminosarum bv. trifolii WSM2297]|uniref:Uncharacterized protein n=1 Tax=Rhizobium leguminosarum bv. trifolii WSM2297 TaxID=754762 RepID=J0KXY0_RHILT|nr:hypothetical protein Rleg4DRAFT_4384 [Rhizobium leguminosarum bv. trifolii WSM2297]